MATTLTLLNLLSAPATAEPALLAATLPADPAAGSFSDLLLEGLFANLPQAAASETPAGEAAAPAEETPWTGRQEGLGNGERKKGSEGSDTGAYGAPWVAWPFLQVVIPVAQPKPLEISLTPDVVSLESTVETVASEPPMAEPEKAEQLEPAMASATTVVVAPVSLAGVSEPVAKAEPFVAAAPGRAETTAPQMLALSPEPVVESRETPAIEPVAERPAARQLAFTATLEPKRAAAPVAVVKTVVRETPAALAVEPVAPQAQPQVEAQPAAVEPQVVPEAVAIGAKIVKPAAPKQQVAAPEADRSAIEVQSPDAVAEKPSPAVRHEAGKDQQPERRDERGNTAQSRQPEHRAAQHEPAQSPEFRAVAAAATTTMERGNSPAAPVQAPRSSQIEGISLAAAEEPKAGPVKDLSLRLQPGPGAGVDLHFVERAGQVEVTVKTQSQGAAEMLGIDLPALQQRLESQGFQATIRTPASAESASPAATTSNNTRQESPSGITAISGDSAAGLDLSSSGDGAAPHQQMDFDELQDAIALRRLRKDRQDS